MNKAIPECAFAKTEIRAKNRLKGGDSMAKSIITQEGHLVNYANIVTITVEISDDGDVYGLIATDTGNSIYVLGTYPSENMAVTAEKS